MTNANDLPSLQAADWLFSHFGALPWSRQPPGILAAITGTLLPPDPEAPPAIQNTGDLAAANEWLQRERQRLQQYTQAQLDRIASEHQALVQRNYQNEQSMILACQELGRKEELVARQTRALQEQAVGLSRREQALARQVEQLSRTQGELAQHRRTEEEAAQQLALLETLRCETAALQKLRETTQAELATMTRELAEQREQRERDQALRRTQQAQMEQRLRALDQAEQAAQRRVAEMDELEAQLRDEFEEQERRLAEKRSEVAALSARLRQRLMEETSSPKEQVPSTPVQG
jgi:hypothetical protein